MLSLPAPLLAAGLRAEAVADRPAADLAACMNAGFIGYLVPVNFDAPTAARRFAAEDLDPLVSRLLFGPDGEPAGLLLIDRRGWHSRVAAMGLAPAWRSQGLGRPLLELVIAEARDRGERTLCLEVFAQNEPAVRLYRRLGFEVVRDLVGYERPAAGEGVGGEELTAADIREVARVVATDGITDLPWQLASETLAAATPPWKAYSLGDTAWAVVQETGPEKCLVRSLVVRRAAQRQGWGRRMLAALAAAYPMAGWFLPPVAPGEISVPFLERIGWQRHALYQHEMRLRL